VLEVTRQGDLLAMDLPANVAREEDDRAALARALRADPVDTRVSRGYHLAVFETEREVREVVPDLAAVKAFGGTGVIVSAPGDQADFVSRFFAPAAGVDEDPVCGSAHCLLTPYWAERLGKDSLRARQVSQRGGTLHCRWPLDGDSTRVAVAGEAVLVLEGRLFLPD